MRMDLMVFLLTALLRVDCGTGNEVAKRMAPLSAISATIADTVAAGRVFPFVAGLQTPNPCWEFHHFEIGRKQETLFVKAYGVFDERPCEQVLDSLAVSGSLSFESPGVYTVEFWRSGQGPLSRTVVAR